MAQQKLSTVYGINFCQICKSYGEQIVLVNFNAELPEKGLISLTGVSGKGKTTILRLLAGLELPDSGIISGLSDKKISYAFQDQRLLPWLSLWENVLLPLVSSSSERALAYFQVMQLSQDVDKFPSAASGGMLQRAALARALTVESEIVLIDEPLQGLDEKLAEVVLVLLKKEATKRLIIVATHEPLELADMVIEV
ncbi:MAG: ATP-binding cassette domain-containing protein [Clostridia bacterium]